MSKSNDVNTAPVHPDGSLGAMPLGTTGARGCCAQTNRHGRVRPCAQKAITTTADGRAWCYYHDPKKPRAFGEGY